MKNYTDEVYEQNAIEVGRKRDEKNRAAWEYILDSEDVDITEGEAHYQRVLKFCQNEITREKFDFLTMTCPEGFDYTNPTWHQGTKANLIAQLLERKRKQLAPTGVLDSRDAVELRNYEVNLHNMTKKELRAKRAEWSFKEEIKDASSARAWLARHRLLKEQQQYFDKNGQQWPRLPAMCVPEGMVSARPLDCFFLYKILDVSGLRRYVARYGEQQINDRVQSTKDSLRSSE